MLNYYRYHDFAEKYFCGHTLTDEHLNNATIEIAKFLVDGGAKEIIENLGICIIESWKDNRMLTRRFCFADKTELNKKQIMSLGLFLPYGAFCGKDNVMLIR